MKTRFIKDSIFVATTAAALGVAFMNPSASLAQYAGAATTRQITINKQVKNPVTGNFMENIDASTYVFLNNQPVVYKIGVTNTGSATLSNIQVQDALPQVLTYVSSDGSFDQNSRNLNFTIPSLGSGQSKEFLINTSVAAATTKGGVTIASCPVNQAVVKVDELSASDQSTICIGPQILGNVTKLPATGPSEAGFVLAGSFIALMLGASLLKTSLLKK